VPCNGHMLRLSPIWDPTLLSFERRLAQDERMRQVRKYDLDVLLLPDAFWSCVLQSVFLIITCLSVWALGGKGTTHEERVGTENYSVNLHINFRVLSQTPLVGFYPSPFLPMCT
jgi:hypothetical protein